MQQEIGIPQEWVELGGRKADVNWQAQWIWIDGPDAPRNYYLCARRELDLPGPSTDEARYRLHISADTRYRLYINGQWIGDGPARSFYWAQQFDTYDVGSHLKPGPNTIAVLVTHYGEGTFQYDPSGKAGLLVQVERQSGEGFEPILGSDEKWQVAPHQGYLRPTTRISCQMPFEEIVDGRKMPSNWYAPDGQLPDARPAKVLGPVGTAPWKHLVARSVPFFTRDPYTPVRTFRVQAVEMPNFHTGFTARSYLLGGYLQQSAKELPGFAATIMRSPVEQDIVVYRWSWRAEDWVINGEEARPGQRVRIKAGDNLCIVPFKTGAHHEYDRSYAIDTTQPVELIGVFNDETAWTVFGPIDDYPAKRESIAKAATVDDLAPYQSHAQCVKEEDILPHGSPFDESTAARAVTADVQVEHLSALFANGATTPDPERVTTVHPPDRGAAELFLDFGQELVGYTELDVHASAGTVFTFNFLEEIEDGQRIHYCDGNQNALRYIASEGRQQFTSFLRRGYRYAKLIIADAREPVRIHGLRTLLATHPANDQGHFECSDPLLTKIWHVGLHTLRCCSEDTFTDCPTYEQTYWVGDGRNESMINYAAFGDIPLTRRCAELPALSLHRKPITESQVPSAWDNLLTAWWLLWIMMVEEHYQYTGDAEYLAGIYPAVRQSIHRGRETYSDERGLFTIDAWNLFDWAKQDSERRCVTHNQMFLVEALLRAANMARTLGKNDDARWFTDYRDALIKAINEHLWDEQRGAYVDSLHDDGKQSPVVSQQTNGLAILYDVAPPDRAERIADYLVRPLEGMVTVGSPFAMFFILEALAHQGRHEEILAIVRDKWGGMIDKGATTFWEMFPGWWDEWWTRSYCHAWSSAPTMFLSRYQLGIWWAQPGYGKARIAPVPLDLNWVRGRVPTPHGPIYVSWEFTDDGDAFAMEIALPPGVAADVYLPVGAEAYPYCCAGRVAIEPVEFAYRISVAEGQEVTIKAAKTADGLDAL